ncbi:RING-H2 finger protein ATL60-like [Prosopis cineraria]|uniref:RING-H2 finger protein ATL60-like n=1 Tax=Prosopis cineraria TaxID=364024 RepID=UPI0024108F23|nr:RING-H2 finger protein ATL60-like [Prosopis cineraria]
MSFNYLKWVLEFLLYHPFYSMRVHHHQPLLQEFHQIVTEEEEEEEEEELEIWRAGGEEEEEVDCAVCLSKIGEGDEIRVLRCEHVFHRLCLNQWIGFSNFTCPLCRDFLGCGIRTVLSGERGIRANRVLFFKFSSFSSDNSESQNWWLR